MIIGTFTYRPDSDTYAGEIHTLAWHRQNVFLNPIDKTSDREPDYRITLANGTELGAAWRRTSERGQEFLSVSIDDPALPVPINAALFSSAEGDTAQLVWNRAKPRKEKVAA